MACRGDEKTVVAHAACWNATLRPAASAQPPGPWALATVPVRQ